jgi:hypothetical protein
MFTKDHLQYFTSIISNETLNLHFKTSVLNPTPNYMFSLGISSLQLLLNLLSNRFKPKNIKCSQTDDKTEHKFFP